MREETKARWKYRLRRLGLWAMVIVITVLGTMLFSRILPSTVIEKYTTEPANR